MDTGLAKALHNHSVDYFGIPIDVRKSNLQKAIRRGLLDQALSSFFAGFDLLNLFPGNQVALATQTNFINRLIVIAGEDVGVANPRLLRTTLPILYAMSARKQARDPGVLSSIIYELVESPKSRLCSHLFHAYKGAAPGASLATPDCFAWITAKPPRELFAALRANCLLAPHLEHFALLERIYNKSSKFGKPNMMRYTLALAYFLVAEGAQGDFVRAEMAKEDVLLRPSPLHHDRGVFIAPLPESEDVHTLTGRKRGSDSVVFRHVGAVVTNAHPLMNDAELEARYITGSV